MGTGVMAFSACTTQGRRGFLLTGLVALVVAGCSTTPRVRPAPAAPSGPHKVAVLVPLTGPDAPVGQAIANAARLALFDSNIQDLRLTVYDTAVGGAGAAAGRAIAEENGLILGPLLSDDVRAVTPIAQRVRVPVIAFSNDSGAAGPGTYILGFTPTQAIARVVGHAASTGAKRFAAVVPASTYGERSTQAFLASVQRAGGQVVGIETYAGPAQARAAARRLSGRAYDAVLLADTPRAAAAAASSVRAGSRILGTELWATGSPGAVPRLRGAWFAAPTEGRWGQFVQRYKARYGAATPPRIASLGYDAVLLTVRASRNWRRGSRFPLGAIDDREGFTGVDGIFRFGRDNVAQRAFEVRAVTATGATVVSPAPSSFP